MLRMRSRGETLFQCHHPRYIWTTESETPGCAREQMTTLRQQNKNFVPVATATAAVACADSGAGEEVPAQIHTWGLPGGFARVTVHVASKRG